MTCSTLRMSTANCRTDRQLRSPCDITLAMLRWTNTSPGAKPVTWLAGTRESEQPIQKYLGACCSDSCLKNSGSSARILSDQARLLSIRCLSWDMALLVSKADILGLGEESHGFHAAFAAGAGLLHAADGRAQVAFQPGIDPDDAAVDVGL